MIFLFILISIVSIFYKAYLQEKLEGEPYAKVYALTGFITFKHFFPLKKKNFAVPKHRAVRKANIALAVFCIGFGLTILIAFVNAVL